MYLINHFEQDTRRGCTILKMFARTRLLLVLVFITAPVIFSSDDVDGVVEECREGTDAFAKYEIKFARKNERGKGEPDLHAPQIKNATKAVYEIELRQRFFQCVYNKLNGSTESLEGNEKYQEMVKKCKSEQPQPKCDPDDPYRTHNGTCNNLRNPTWGAALTCERRMMSPFYEGAAGFRKSKCKNQTLPKPRTVSIHYTFELVPNLQIPSSSHFIYFGQFLAHDILDTAVTFVGDKRLECCKNLTSEGLHPQCASIDVSDDLFYKVHLIDCLDFVRAAMCDTCSAGKRSHINGVTAFTDLSVVYSSMKSETEKLRLYDSGKLRTRSNSVAGQLLPANEEIDPERCGEHIPLSGATGPLRKKRDLTSLSEGDPVETVKDVVEGACFHAGDRRVNQHTPLMIYHTLFVREHNRIATELQKLNPHWTDEKLYQVARAINIAQFQAIVYSEYLPHLLQEDIMTEYDLSITDNHSVYDEELDPSITAEFAGAAFRQHNMVDGRVGALEVELRYLFGDSTRVYLGEIEKFIAGISKWPYKQYSTKVATDLNEYMYKERVGTFGLDLPAANIQRGRDLGLPPYADVLEHFHGVKINTFADLASFIAPDLIAKLKTFYCDVRDIDLWIGLISEIKKGKLISPTAAKIIALQFKNLKGGDRFFFSHNEVFTDEQFAELQKSSLSGIFCRNSKIAITQPKAIEALGLSNVPISCDLIPKVNLTPWKEEKN